MRSLLWVSVVWFGLWSLVGCVAPAERACKTDSDCAQSPPRVFCFEGVCSTQQCKSGQQSECYEGTLSSLNRGLCSAGRKVCNVDGLWSACYGQRLPVPEICDREDNDCDGEIDEGINCSCKPGEKQSCYSGQLASQGKGTCQAGTQFCEQDNQWGRCLDQVLPQIEICDGKDNDCDGSVDNGLTCTCEPGTKRSCYSGSQGCSQKADGSWACKGLCSAGQQVCGPNRDWGACEKQVLPKSETCDGKDNNCDGRVDETCGCPKPGLQEYCYTGKESELKVRESMCRQGRRVCLDNGEWSTCFGEVKPSPEVCDGKDNDCNGKIDDEYPEKSKACIVPEQQGPCATGEQACVEGKLQCKAFATAEKTEICGNGIDDNCDGTVDESPPCDCIAGQAQTCFSKGPGCTRSKDGTWSCEGICKTGTQYCQPNGTWGACQGEILATTETCDGQDNNCNGSTDETWPTKGTTCSAGNGGCQNTGTWLCDPDGTKVVCNVQATSPTPEVCDDQDNDCDGQVDEGLQRSCYSGAKSTAGIGNCRSGIQACSLGKWGVCVGEVTSQKEVCDGKDNNCDGAVDEGQIRQCYTGPSNTQNKGGCKGGFQACTNGSWGACQSQVLPSAEVCDGKDNDCDGSVDESLQRSCYTGASGTQGKGLCKAGTQTCTKGTWSSCGGQILPQTETCDGKDNDCDGIVDNVLRRDCYTGPFGTKGVGRCHGGYQECKQSKWSPCLYQKVPRTETCDNIDNNCDGKVDEGCSCSPGQTQTCGSSVGTCQQGRQTCNSQGQWGPCAGEVKPVAEKCDGKDNNCDGRIDENWPLKNTTCTVGQTECRRSGVYVCTTSQTAVRCSASAGQGQAEICDGKDNNCNGIIDENITRSCYSGPSGTSGKGGCKQGSQTCTNGTWGTCTGQVLPSQEVCNNKDDNCNGQIDESLTQSCYTGPQGTSGWGICKTGQRTCSAGKWGACVGEILPATETCDNKDNNCNGKIDDGIQRSCYTGPTKTLGMGVCTKGVQSCSAGKWGACQGEVLPSTETCDGKDNDCDGKVDEENPGGGGACTTSRPGICSLGIRYCNNGTFLCRAKQSPTQETCNGKDDDCDGSVDEAITQACKTSCGAGTQQCINGTWAKNCMIPSLPEKCDRKDNDCDGQVDEGCDCGDCQSDNDCINGSIKGKCVSGYCAYPCTTNADCKSPLVCNNATSGSLKNHCTPPYNSGQPLWTCKQYHKFAKKCVNTANCGGGDSQTSRGAVCHSSQCRLYCRQDKHCPSGGYECNNRICLPD